LGGIPKGLLRHPCEPTTLVERAIALGIARGLEVVLVGRKGAYAHLGLKMLVDSPEGIGPMGGLAALIDHAGSRDAIALACDMPQVPMELIDRLCSAQGGAAVVPRRGEGLEPLCALYRPAAIVGALERALSGREFALQSLLARVEVREIKLIGEQEHWVDDWDAPSDLMGP